MGATGSVLLKSEASSTGGLTQSSDQTRLHPRMPQAACCCRRESAILIRLNRAFWNGVQSLHRTFPHSSERYTGLLRPPEAERGSIPLDIARWRPCVKERETSLETAAHRLPASSAEAGSLEGIGDGRRCRRKVVAFRFSRGSGGVAPGAPSPRPPGSG